MKTIKTTKKTTVYKDHDAVIKIGPRETILHEAEVLRRLADLDFVPKLLSVSEVINGPSDQLTMVMTEVEGVISSDAPSIDDKLIAMEERGVIPPYDVDVISDGSKVGIVGFMSRAKLKEEV